jgi:phage tail-like protein
MTRSTPKAYRFQTADQWSTCLCSGFEVTRTGAIQPQRQLGLHAVQVTRRGPVEAIAVDSLGEVVSRRPAIERVVPVANAERFNSLGQLVDTLEVEGMLATSPRWVADAEALWAFAPRSGRVGRFDRETLQLLWSVNVKAVDIASDGRTGLWTLVRDSGNSQRLIHLDCRGRFTASLPLDRPAWQLGCANGAESLVLLDKSGTTLRLIDSAHASALHTIEFSAIRPGWTASRLSTDGRNQIVVGGTVQGTQYSLLQFSASGELRSGDLTDLFVPPAQWADGTSTAIPADFSAKADTVWFALADGVWRLDSTAASGARETIATLLTPLLYSPHTASLRGWLRAEVDITLPEGAVLSADVMSSNDARVATNLGFVAADRSRSLADRQDTMASSLEPVGQTITVTGPSDSGQAVSIPMFATQDQWLMLRLTVVVPPDGELPTLRALRVLYPEVSINQYLPAFFRSPDGDSGTVLRRLVGVLEATTQGLDAEIGGIGRRIDARTVDPSWMDFLAGWLALPWHAALSETAKRAILINSGQLLDKRGTRAGLQLLLDCLIGSGASIVDTAVDTPPTLLGGGGTPGSSLPVMLVGTSPRVARLNGLAILGRARIPCASTNTSPLATVPPTIRLRLATPTQVRQQLEPIIANLLADYLPAGLRLVIRWTRPANEVVGTLILDGNGPRTLGSDSILGETILAGHSQEPLAPDGLTVGFRLQ